MKIDNTGNIKALTLALLQSQATKDLVKLGQTENTNSSPTGKQFSQLSQLLLALNLFPTLFRMAPPSDKGSPLHTLLAQLVLPSEPKLAAKWLAERQPDKALIDALQVLKQGSESDEQTSLRAAVQLLSEQRIQDASSKPGELTWLFCFGEIAPTKVTVSVKKKTAKKRKKSRWSVSINLTLSNNRQLTATAELEEQSLDLSFTTNSESLEHLVKKAQPALEVQLAKHNINVTSCEVVTTTNTVEPSITNGLSIQV